MHPGGILLDIDGVVVVSWEPIEGSVEAIERLRAAGLPVRYVTNTTSRSAADSPGAGRPR